MDLLASYQMDVVPEHQTRTVHLMARHPDFSMHLGFNACCTCGCPFSPSSTVVECKVCRRVKYCSESCREQDASALPSVNDGEEEEEQGMGHSPVMCALLRLCNHDEAVESGDTDWSSEDDENNIESSAAARNRVLSEYESYPATLANGIEHPCFQKVLKKCSSNKELVIHVLGASEDAELWNYADASNKDIDMNTVMDAYAEAVAELAEKRGLDIVQLYLIGPDCPKKNLTKRKKVFPMDGPPRCELIMRTLRGNYDESLLKSENVTKPDLAVIFNPGFTCPDYEWTEALMSIDNGTPFLISTNTELEGIADSQYLLERDMVRSVPAGLAEMLGMDASPNEDEDGNELSFFCENPFSGNRVRQSGTMANDLFVKSRWIMGGVLEKKTAQAPSKKRRMAGSRNTKAGNPALI